MRPARTINLPIPGLGAIEVEIPPDAPDSKPIPNTRETSNFCPASLRDWIHACRRANIPYVPAHFVGAIRRWEYIHCYDAGPHQQRLDDKLEHAGRDAESNTMLRFDCCAGIDTKLRLSEGDATWTPELQRLYAGDPRGFDVIFEFPREHIPIWKRPWVEAMIIDQYPVEYRVFVNDDKLVGISNYYPQRPLPLIEAHIETVTRYVNQLLDNIPTPFLWNRSNMQYAFKERFDISRRHFTADFIVDRHENVLFLEGGPPHQLGAAPCCFPVGQTEGLALAAPPLAETG